MKAVFDTNILVDYLNGLEPASKEFSLYGTAIISIITFVEVLVGARNDGDEKIIRGFLASFRIRDVSGPIAEEAIALRRLHRLKVPNAIVYATARVEGCLLVSRNTRDLKTDWPDVRVPYEV